MFAGPEDSFEPDGDAGSVRSASRSGDGGFCPPATPPLRPPALARRIAGSWRTRVKDAQWGPVCQWRARHPGLGPLGSLQPGGQPGRGNGGRSEGLARAPAAATTVPFGRLPGHGVPRPRRPSARTLVVIAGGGPVPETGPVWRRLTQFVRKRGKAGRAPALGRGRGSGPALCLPQKNRGGAASRGWPA